MKHPKTPGLWRRFLTKFTTLFSSQTRSVVAIIAVVAVMLVGASLQGSDGESPTSASSTATTTSGADDGSLSSSGTPSNGSGSTRSGLVSEADARSYQPFVKFDPLTSRKDGKMGAADTAVTARIEVAKLVEVATLVSLSNVLSAAESGHYDAAWIDDPHAAVLLVPSGHQLPADAAVTPVIDRASATASRATTSTSTSTTASSPTSSGENEEGPAGTKPELASTRANTSGASNDEAVDQVLLAFYPTSYAATLLEDLQRLGVDVRVGPSFDLPQPDGGTNWFMIFILAVLFWYLYKAFRAGRWGMAGQAKQEKPEGGEIPTTRFTDVAGVEEALDEMKELVSFLKEPERFEATGAKPPRGALMSGPPGTGKTLLARAVAGEAGVPFFAVSGSDFTEMYVGVGARRVRELFAKARKADRAIVFIDEIDAVARRRSESTGNSGGAETENTLIALLNEMDGFNGTHVIVLAATNRPDTLDPAITRPGRLDRKIVVPTPDRRGRQKILEVHAKGRPLADDVDFVHVARRTPGMSGAELAHLINEACLEAARRRQADVDASCFDAAVATVAMGRARTSALVTEKDRLLTAWHEAGHTICALLQEHADDPVSVSIIPRGPAGGVTWMSGSDDMFLPKNRALARLVTALGGRAAEEMLLDGSYTQGAHGDLDSATNLAMAMATQYGMTRLGLMVRSPQLLASGGMDDVTAVVEDLLADALDDARTLLRENADLVEATVAELLDKETLSMSEIVEVHRRVLESRKGRGPVRLLEDVAIAAQDELDDIDEPVEPIRPRGGGSTTRPLRRTPRPALTGMSRMLDVTGRVLRRAALERHRRVHSARARGV